VRVLQNRRPAIPANFQPDWQNPVTNTRSKERPVQNTGNAIISDGRPVVQGIPLVAPSDLPDKISTIFPFPLFNAVQSKCFNTVFNTDDNLVVSAPTGSGKTAVMELAIARLITSTKNTDFKIVYMAPIKALCAERQQDWQKKFNIHGLTCAELTGDTDFDQLRKVQQAQIIITTPEKWDSVTRKWRDNSKLVQMIKLFLVDEVHILKDSRGATLEAVVSRMKSVGTPIRFIALSATVPNSEDIAAWLGRDSTTPQEPSKREVFDESFRPVKLEKHVYGFQGGFNDFQLDVKLRSK
jgi:ATP-dependent DNA helicase HFM1/MER3